MLELPRKWIEKLSSKPETGMGYQIVGIILIDGSRFDQAVIVEGRVTQIRGLSKIPFSAEQIQDIIVTHDKWDF